MSGRHFDGETPEMYHAVELLEQRQLFTSNPAADFGGLYAIESVTLHGISYFAADDNGKHGVELWKTDGTPSGTSMVRSLAAGKASSAIANLVVIGDRVLFFARPGA